MLSQSDELGSGHVARAVVVLSNKWGLHCRPAGALVQLAKSFRSQVKLTHNNLEADGKSILAVMALGAEYRAVVFLEATGEDANAAVAGLRAFIHRKLGEPE